MERPSDSRRLFHWLVLLLLIAVGAVDRLLYLARKPFWFDEFFSVEVARIGWGNFLHLLWWREANMSLYYLLLRIWLHGGQSEYFIRSLSVVFAVATIPAIYWLGVELYDRRVGLIASALFAFNAYSVRYAQEARSYALFLLLATLSSCFLIAWLREPSRKNRIGYVVVSVLAVYAHFYALLLIAVHWLASRWRGKHSKIEIGQLRGAWICIGIAVLPLLIFVAKTGAGPIKWISRPGLGDVFAFYKHLAGGATWPLLAVFAAACTTAVLPVAKRLLSRDRGWETFRCQFLLIWLLLPVALTVVLSFARPVFLGRYMIFCLPPLIVLASAGLARLRNAWILTVALAVMLLLSAQGIGFVYANDFDSERDASGAAAEFILQHAQPGDAIVFHIAETRLPYEFFRGERDGPEIIFPTHGWQLDYRDFTGKPTVDLLRTAAEHPRLWVMLMNNGTAEKPDATTVMMSQVLSEKYPAADRWEFYKVEVRLYRRTQ
jgi:uncharacterized membrane protein